MDIHFRSNQRTHTNNHSIHMRYNLFTVRIYHKYHLNEEKIISPQNNPFTIDGCIYIDLFSNFPMLIANGAHHELNRKI